MAVASGHRSSPGQESAPLLSDSDLEDSQAPHHDPGPPPSFLDRLENVVYEPLTPLTQVLLVTALVLLLISSVFVGLFAGVTEKLRVERGRNGNGGDGGGGGGGGSVTITTTTTAATTDITTTTRATTTTIAIPIPIPTSPPEKEEACLTPQCIVLSASILSSLDVSQDPCENFYDFANGGWLKSHVLPSDKGSFSQFEALSQRNKQIIQQILHPSNVSSPMFASHETPADTDYDAHVLEKLRALYSSCLDEQYLARLGQDPLMRVVRTIRMLFWEKNTLSGTPAEDEEMSAASKIKGDGLTAALAYVHSRGIDALFNLDIEGDVGNDPNMMALWFVQPSLGLPSKEYYDDESIMDLYRRTVERLLFALDEEEDEKLESDHGAKSVLVSGEIGSNAWPPFPWPPWDGGGDGDDKKEPRKNKTERARDLAKEVLEFEKEIAQASLDLDILFGDPIATYNPAPLSNLTEALPQIHFADYFSTFTPRSFPSSIILTDPTFPYSLSTLLSSTANNTIEAYLVTRAALQLAPLLDTESEPWLAVRTLQERLTGIKKGAVGDRAEFCVGKVESSLGFAAGRYFVEEVFGGKSKEKGTKIIETVVDAFKAHLPQLDWMDEESAVAAAEKADAIRVKVGYPLSPDTLSARSIYLYYLLVKVQEYTFFENVISAATVDVFRQWMSLGKQRDPERWQMWPSMVNAYFDPPANEIVFPAGILQPPFFSQEWPAYLSYGSFGMVAAHELTHAFDSSGRLYDPDGRLREWWTDRTSEGFEERARCIAKQYSEYTIDDGEGGKIHLNGNLTSGENIGDAGLIYSYRAWKSHFDESFRAGNEYTLPGLNYTREQLFFISFARVWANKMTPASAVQRVFTDPHSPARYRVDGTVRNIPEFAKAFHCSSKAKLNPPDEERCVLW